MGDQAVPAAAISPDRIDFYSMWRGTNHDPATFVTKVKEMCLESKALEWMSGVNCHNPHLYNQVLKGLRS